MWIEYRKEIQIILINCKEKEREREDELNNLLTPFHQCCRSNLTVTKLLNNLGWKIHWLVFQGYPATLTFLNYMLILNTHLPYLTCLVTFTKGGRFGENLLESFIVHHSSQNLERKEYKEPKKNDSSYYTHYREN